MQIKKLYGIEGAREAKGLVVVVDVIRAATVEACALSKGVKKILPVGTKEEAFALKNENPEFLIAGEQSGYKIEGFDFGNSPTEMLEANINNKVIIHRSTEGTQGLVNATHADELIFGSFVTLSAIRNHIKKVKPKIVSIVAMGGPEGEDGMFANFLEEELNEKNPDMKTVKEYLTTYDGLARYFDGDDTDFPIKDFHLCLNLDLFNFFCKVENSNGELRTIKGHS